MARREWTVVVVSEGRTGVRQFRVPREIARLGIAAALLLFAVLGTAAAGALDRSAGPEARLARENELLRAELRRMDARLDTLRGSVDELSGRDEFIRLLAGLDPLDPAVRLAGIGGPAKDGPEHSPLWRVDRALARRAFAAGGELNGLLRRARLLSFSWAEAEDQIDEQRARLAATPSIFPTAGYVSSTFTTRRWHPLLDRPRPHEGLDIVAPAGTPIVAAAAGRVRFAGMQGEYGLMLEVDHGWGVVTRYAHASRLLARVGQVVQRGDTIARVGRTGLAMGPHLHYEVLVDGRPANPRRFILSWNTIPD